MEPGAVEAEAMEQFAAASTGGEGSSLTSTCVAAAAAEAAATLMDDAETEVKPNAKEDSRFLVPKNEDIPSRRGQFGWHTLTGIHVPYIFRTGNVRFICIHIVITELFPRFLNYFNQHLFDLFKMARYKMTHAEWRLYDEINKNHCDKAYGRKSFRHLKRMVLLDDIIQLHDFLDFIHGQLAEKKRELHPRCGFMHYGSTHVVPFCVIQGKRYAPVDYFQGADLKSSSRHLTGFDECVIRCLMYLHSVETPKRKIFVVRLNFPAVKNQGEEKWIEESNIDIFTKKEQGDGDTIPRLRTRELRVSKHEKRKAILTKNNLPVSQDFCRF